MSRLLFVISALTHFLLDFVAPQEAFGFADSQVCHEHWLQDTIKVKIKLEGI
jgi:hypothetical protein